MTRATIIAAGISHRCAYCGKDEPQAVLFVCKICDKTICVSCSRGAFLSSKPEERRICRVRCL